MSACRRKSAAKVTANSERVGVLERFKSRPCSLVYPREVVRELRHEPLFIGTAEADGSHPAGYPQIRSKSQFSGLTSCVDEKVAGLQETEDVDSVDVLGAVDGVDGRLVFGGRDRPI